MNKDQIILILILIILFVLIFSSVYFMSIVFAKQRCKRFGLNIDFKQARILSKSKCLKKDFIIGLKNIWIIYPVQLDKLINHYYAGGDLDNLNIGINEMLHRDKEPDLLMLTALNLTHKDLKIEVERAEKNDWKFIL